MAASGSTAQARPPRLYQRGRIWWFRARVPRPLVDIIGKPEYRFSLRTTDLAHAVTLERQHSQKIDADIARAWAKIDKQLPSDPKTIQSLTDQLLEQIISQAPLRYAGLDWTQYDRRRRIGDLDSAVDVILKRAGYVIPVNNPAFDRARQTARRLLGRKIHNEADRRGLAALPGLQLIDLIKAYEAARAGAWNRKTLTSNRTSFLAAREALGDRYPVAEIDSAALAAIRSLLAALPPNSRNRRDFQGLGLRAAAQLAAEHGIAGLSPHSVASYMANLRSMMLWAIDDGACGLDRSYRRLLDAPAFTLLPRTEAARRAFTVDELTRIFSAPLYQGCRNDGSGYWRPGPNRPRRGRFWVPLIALYTGLPLNEACRLTPARCRHYRGRYFLISDDEKKTYLPDFFKDLEWGRLVSAARRQGRDSLIFAELPQGSTGYASDPFSKWFTRFLASIGLEDPGLSFQSFNLTHRQYSPDAGLPAAIIEPDIARLLSEHRRS